MLTQTIAAAAMLTVASAQLQCLGGGPSNPLPAGDHTITFPFDGQTRSTIIRVPATYERSNPTPVVLSFHGFSNSAEQQCTNSGTRALSEEYGFVGVCPEGLGRSWNGGECCGDTRKDSVGFARELVKQVADRVCVAEDSVYSIGYSNGGYMSYRLACEASDLVAGILNVAGLLSSANAFPCNPERQVPVLHVHGTADPTINYAAAGIAYERYAEQVHGCARSQTTSFQNGTVTCATKDGCPAGFKAQFCAAQGMRHAWPGCYGTPGTGSGCSGPTFDIDSLDYAWNYWMENKLE